MNQVASVAALMAIALSSAVCRADPPRIVASPKALSERQNGPVPMKRTRPLAPWHRITVTPRPGLPRIHTYDKFNPVWWFGNADEPVPPESYKPGDRHRVMKWKFRNPFHNFTSYVIGIADKKFVRSGRHPESISNPDGGWNYAVSRRRWLRLPFISYRRGKFESYFGWREHGSFGIKVNIR